MPKRLKRGLKKIVKPQQTTIMYRHPLSCLVWQSHKDENAGRHSWARITWPAFIWLGFAIWFLLGSATYNSTEINRESVVQRISVDGRDVIVYTSRGEVVVVDLEKIRSSHNKDKIDFVTE